MLGKSALVSYERDSDDAYSDEEEENDNGEKDEKDPDSNSNNGSSSHADPSFDPTLTDLSQEEIATDSKPESKVIFVCLSSINHLYYAHFLYSLMLMTHLHLLVSMLL